jgi:hypothetical protein
VIKFSAKVKDVEGGDRDLVVLGLAQTNLDQLRDGIPLQIDTSQAMPEGVGLGGGPVLFIFADRDEAMVMERLRKLGAVDEDTHVVFSEGLTAPSQDDAA